MEHQPEYIELWFCDFIGDQHAIKHCKCSDLCKISAIFYSPNILESSINLEATNLFNVKVIPEQTSTLVTSMEKKINGYWIVR
jgi:hypothetical protein